MPYEVVKSDTISDVKCLLFKIGIFFQKHQLLVEAVWNLRKDGSVSVAMHRHSLLPGQLLNKRRSRSLDFMSSTFHSILFNIKPDAGAI